MLFYALDDSPQAGRLAAIITKCGQRLTMGYTDGLLTAINDDYNRPVTIHYNADRRIEKISAFTGQEISYSYDAEGNLTSVRTMPISGTPNGNDFPNGKEWRYTYLTQIGSSPFSS